MEGDVGPDLRFDFMGSFIQKTLKLKPEKWLRLLTIEEHKAVLKEFLDGNTTLVLIIILTQSAQLLPTTSFPLTQLKSKGWSVFLYFTKRRKNGDTVTCQFFQSLQNDGVALPKLIK